jgi:hypothetical protein
VEQARGDCDLVAEVLNPDGTVHWIVPGAGHSKSHATDPAGYESRVTEQVRAALASTAMEAPIIEPTGQRSDDSPDPADMPDPASTVED